MTRKTENKKYDYFSANVQAAEIESQLVESQQRIASLEALNAQLQSLIASSNSNNQSSYIHVGIDKIIRNPQQVRRYFDPEQLASLTASIKEVGVRSPLWVRPTGDDKYLLIAGERRYRAAEDAGLEQVPVVLVEVDDASAFKLSLLENLQRVDLNPVEETEGILHLLSVQLDCTPKEVVALLNRKAHADKKKVSLENSDTENVFRKQWSIIENVFTTVGKLSPESFRVSRLPLLNMPEDVLEVLRLGQIEHTKARLIATVVDQTARTDLLAQAIAEKLSLTQIRARIKAIKPPELPSLKKEFQQISLRVLKSSQWDNPNKAEKIATLLQELETLLKD